MLGCSRSNITYHLNKMGFTSRKSKIDNISLRNKISQSLIGRNIGKDNPNYKGYKDEKIIARGIFKTLARDMIRNNNYTCSFCGKIGGNLEVHHIKPFRIIFEEFVDTTYSKNINNLYNEIINYPDFVDKNNLVVLCHDCHFNVHYTDNHELSPYRWESATTIENIL